MSCPAEEGWPNWRTVKAIDEEARIHGSYAAAARAHGMKPNTITTARRSLGGDALPVGMKARPVTDSPEDDTVLSALKRLKDDASIEALADECDLAPRRVRESLERLGHQGYRVQEDEQRVTIQRLPVPSQDEHRILFDGDEYRFAIVSDVHLNSKHCRIDELHIAYDRIHAEGITEVYNPGDIVSGLGIFRGQDHEILNHTFESQVQFAVENYPVRDGVTTRIISGNHDCEGDFGRAGADACMGVANQREDLEWCGRYFAPFELPNGAVMEMRHPMGGSSYAKSYKPQKFAESFEGGYKPAIVLFGHWHNVEWGFHRNIFMVNCGTFEGYGGSLGHRVPLGAPAVGFWIVTLRIGDDGSVVRFLPEFFPFFHGRRAG